ncbi:MAG TPA: DUF3618 domain-containing protein [Gaiellaceae bacterium]
MTRTQEQIRNEIEAEREQLSGAVAQLRAETNVAAKLKPKLPLVAVGAASLGLLRLLARRRH